MRFELRCAYLTAILLACGLRFGPALAHDATTSTRAKSSATTTLSIPNPILFVTQFPVTEDFGAIGSVFANHRGDIQFSGRGGDLHIVYPDGVVRNLTAEAGYGIAGGQLQEIGRAHV